jgi:hypothetical protein
MRLLENAKTRWWAGGVGVALLLGLLTLALGLPGLRALPVTDRDEARYAQASKQMVESGDYLRIRFLDEARNKKPAGIYWLQSAAVKISGVKDAIWPYRMVSVIAALAAVWLVYWSARRLAPAAAAPAAAALAASPLLVIVAHAATTDAALLAATCLAQGCLARLYLTPPAATRHAKAAEWTTALVFWLAQGLGILIKGPLTPLVSGLTLLALWLYERRSTAWLRRLHAAWGVLLLLLLVLPWLIAIQHATGGAFLREALGHDFAGKIQRGQEMHGAPPGVYLLTATLLFWPFFPLAWRGLGQAWRARRTDPSARFLLAWLMPAWLVFELAPTKLPHYVLPLYPVLALLALRWLIGWAGPPDPPQAEGGATDNAAGAEVLLGRAGPPDPPRAGMGALCWRVSCRLVDMGWWLAAGVWVLGPPLIGRLLGWRWMSATLLCSALAGATAWAFWRAWRARQAARALAIAVAFALLFYGLLFTAVLPRLDDLWLTRKVATLAQSEAATHGRPLRVFAFGYTEPSLAFMLGSATRFNAPMDEVLAELRRNPDAAVLAQERAPAPPRLLPVSAALWERLANAVAALPKHCCRQDFLDAAQRAGVAVREAGYADGFNYSRTKRVRVYLYLPDGTPKERAP